MVYNTKQIVEMIPLEYGIELTHVIRMSKCESFDWTGLSKSRKSYTYIDAPMATIKLNPERDMDSTSAAIFLWYATDFASRVSQNIIFLSKPAEITWPTTTE